MDKDIIALFDLDDTLANYSKALYNDLDRIRDPKEPLPIVFNKDPEKHLSARVDLIRNVPGWWRKLERLKLGFDILKEAKKLGFNIHILTQGPLSCPNSWTEKLQWSQRHVPEATPIVTRNKSITYGRVLVDDYPVFLKEWLDKRPRGIGIMPANEMNKDFTHPRVIRYDGQNLKEVKKALKWARDRK